MIPAAVGDALSALRGVGGTWFDSNPLASEYIFPENWSPWDWVQFGGTSQMDSPLQLAYASAPSAPNLPDSGPFTFLAEVKGKYEIHIDRKTSSGKPATNTALFVKQNEITIRLHIVTPFDLWQVKLLLQYACAIFPANAPEAKPTVIRIYHPKLTLFQRNSFVMVSMGYPMEPRDGKPGYVESVWLPQDVITATQNQVGTFPASSGAAGSGPSQPGPAAQAPTATPPVIASPFGPTPIG